MSERTIFLAALELDPAQRAAYLDEACQGDAAVRGRVEQLLAAESKSGEFLDRPAVEQLSGKPSEAGRIIDATRDSNDADGDPQAERAAAVLAMLQPSTDPNSLGRLGNYEIREVLGSGGFGTVLKAFDLKLERLVAVKVMAPELAITSPPRKRFLREARTAAQIRHENVVAVHAVEEQPLPYLVMEYIPGETLQETVDRSGPLDAADVIRIGRQIAAGLAAAHQVGLVHRDVKPGNILLEAGMQPRVKITDFGLARTIDDASLTQSGTIIGTPMYMSPEQAHGQPLDQRSDLFSLGSVLYLLCTGRPPFRAASTLSVLKRVVDDEARPIQEISPELPAALINLIARLHEKDPAERYANAVQVVAALDAVAGSPQAAVKAGVIPAGEPKKPRRDPRPSPVRSAYVPIETPGPRYWTMWRVAFLGMVILLGTFFGLIVIVVALSYSYTAVHSVATAINSPAPATYGYPADVADGWTINQPAWGVYSDLEMKLRELNPEFTSTVDVQREKGETIGLRFPTEHITDVTPVTMFPQLRHLYLTAAYKSGRLADLSPLASLRQLTELDVSNSRVNSLAPLVGLSLTKLDASAAPIIDLKPLAGMPLQELYLVRTNIDDLSPLKGAPLRRLHIGHTFVSDLSPVIGMPLEALTFENTRVVDLTPIKDLKVTLLDLTGLMVSDLTPIKDLPLTSLDLRNTKVTDLSPVAHMKLRFLGLRGCPVTDLKPLKDMPLRAVEVDELTPEVAELLRKNGLETINNYPAGDFFRDYDKAIREGKKPSMWAPARGADPFGSPGSRPASGLVPNGMGPPDMGPTGSSDPFMGSPPGLSPFDAPGALGSGGPGMMMGSSGGGMPSEGGSAPGTGPGGFGFDPGGAMAPGAPGALPDPTQQVESWLSQLLTDAIRQANPEFQGGVAVDVQEEKIVGVTLQIEHFRSVEPLTELVDLRSVRLWGVTKNNPLSDLSPLKGKRLVELACTNTRVADLQPLRGMPLKKLSLNGSPVVSLAALAGMPLEELQLEGTNIDDLAPLKGAPLRRLHIGETFVSDLSPLSGLPLEQLWLGGTRVTDLAPLKGLPLTSLAAPGLAITDVSMLADSPLTDLDISKTQVTSLQALRGLKLTRLCLEGSRVVDLSPLAEMPLRELRIDEPTPEEAEMLRKKVGLETINGQHASDFFHDFENAVRNGTTKKRPPVLDAPSSGTSGRMMLPRGGDAESLPAPTPPDAGNEKGEAINKKLRDANPRFDGAAKYAVDKGEVVGLDLDLTGVTDISAFAEAPALWMLTMSGRRGNGELTDLKPLQGRPLTELECSNTTLKSLDALRGLPLVKLNVRRTLVVDLQPLTGMELTELNLDHTNVQDLTPLSGMPLTSLNLKGTFVSDLTPLAGLPLRELILANTQVKDLTPVNDLTPVTLDLSGLEISDLSAIKDMPLTSLNLNDTLVVDLAPIAHMKLTSLSLRGTKVRNLSALKEMPLRELEVDQLDPAEVEFLRAKGVETINRQNAANFFRDYYRLQQRRRRSEGSSATSGAEASPSAAPGEPTPPAPQNPPFENPPRKEPMPAEPTPAPAELLPEEPRSTPAPTEPKPTAEPNPPPEPQPATPPATNGPVEPAATP